MPLKTAVFGTGWSGPKKSSFEKEIDMLAPESHTTLSKCSFSA
jgi:hypothetical protein